MPELPEVETVRRQLEAELPGRRIRGVRVLLPRTLKNITPGELEERLKGRRFASVERRGKFLLLRLDDGASLIIHLRMTGRLTVVDAAEPDGPYTRVAVALDDGRELRFHDMRTFGTWHYVGEGADSLPPGLRSMGVEPLSDAFSPDALAAICAGRRAPVKAVLLDQRRIAGIGNIYADEALFRAGIDPGRPAGSLTEEELARLHKSIRDVLTDSLAKGGTTVRDYVNGRGAPGEFQHYLDVYGRAGEPCRRCGTPIVRRKLAGRGTHACPQCQR
ncbi:MAG: DNA-formamidopyrimidine glycosylase [Bacillota bacterium]|nr:MAG: DNA-formamidopyrimidine glycosylase [Bacillota bacterium]